MGFVWVLERKAAGELGFDGWDVCVHPYDLTIELTPWHDESYVLSRPISTDSSGVQCK